MFELTGFHCIQISVLELCQGMRHLYLFFGRLERSISHDSSLVSKIPLAFLNKDQMHLSIDFFIIWGYNEFTLLL